MKPFVTLIALPLVLFSGLGFSAPLNYSIVVDAGSSGSRLYVYSYDTSTGVPTIKKEYTYDNLKPGLASLKPSEVQNYLQPLLDGAHTFLKDHGIDQKATPVSFLGTAGMRLINDSKQEQALYQEVRSALDHNNFIVRDVKTIPGEMEGLYSWMDVNYLLGNFQNHSKTVGSIDMGGASTQIAYSTTKTESPNVISFDIDSISYSVFTKSFLGLGQDAFLASMKKYDKSAACFLMNYIYQEPKKGAFNSDSCAQIYNDMLDKAEVKKQVSEYPMDGQSFIAYSGIYYTFNFFKSDISPISQADLESKIKNVCYKDWADIKSTYPTVEEPYLSTYCANGVYEDQLLFNTYKLQGSQLTITKKVAGQSVDWTLGAVLYDLVTPKS